ncbi:hypothetical protein E6H31_10180 [Candidatus Bathyarchaeota archaeon]|nr:MAG: hypothetical protein E6H31_10180 [Candidatus Bathyarchaeota archaeon]
MSIQKQDYFVRQSAIPEIGPSGLQRLQSAKIVVVGTGGVGSAAAYFLASLGTGQLTLIDQDIVEESNLHRFLGADRRDLHQPKAEVLQRKLGSRHPWTRTEAIVETLRTENCNELTTLPTSSPAPSRTRAIYPCSTLQQPRASNASCRPHGQRQPATTARP